MATFASSYIPTTSAAVTRNADVLTWPIDGNYNESQGTLYCETDIAQDVANIVALKLGDNQTDYHHLMNRPGKDPTYRVENGNSLIVDIEITNDDFDGSLKPLAATYATDDFQFYTSGVSRGTDTGGTPPTLTGAKIHVGNNTPAGAGAEIYAHVRNVQIFSERLTSFDVARIR